MSIFMISPKVEETKGDSKPIVVTDMPKDVSTEQPNIIMPVNDFMPQKELDEASIVVDGPLSQIYTQALNQMYAKEGYVTEELKSLNVKGGRYLFAMEGMALEKGNYIEAFESFRVACENTNALFVCIEHDMNVTPKVAAFLAYARECGATILDNRVHALEYFAGKVKK